MSKGNIADELQFGVDFPKPSAAVVKIINVKNTDKAKHDSNFATLFAYGTSVPSSVSGFLSGCLFIDTSAAADSQLLINEATLSSCTFNGMS